MSSTIFEANVNRKKRIKRRKRSTNRILVQLFELSRLLVLYRLDVMNYLNIRQLIFRTTCTFCYSFVWFIRFLFCFIETFFVLNRYKKVKHSSDRWLLISRQWINHINDLFRRQKWNGQHKIREKCHDNWHSLMLWLTHFKFIHFCQLISSSLRVWTQPQNTGCVSYATMNITRAAFLWNWYTACI